MAINHACSTKGTQNVYVLKTTIDNSFKSKLDYTV